MYCPRCKASFYDLLNKCPKCGLSKKEIEALTKEIEQANSEDSKRKERILAEEAARKESIRQNAEKNMFDLKRCFLSTTGIGFDGYHISSYIGIKNGEIVIGTGLLTKMSAAISDDLGSSNTELANKLMNAKNMALDALIENCILDGANAVIGVDTDIMTISNTIIVVSATGTAVIVDTTC